jgi:hypothetical protein
MYTPVSGNSSEDEVAVSDIDKRELEVCLNNNSCQYCLEWPFTIICSFNAILLLA